MTDPILTIGMIDINIGDTIKGSYEVAQNPLSAEASRNMAGTLIESFIGYFPSVSLTVIPKSFDEARDILTQLRNRSMTVTYFDLHTGQNETATMYPSPVSAKPLSECMADGIDIKLTSVSKANYY